MIVFDLSCGAGHRFEGWFATGTDFDNQSARGLVSCPHCGSGEVGKAPMAPAVPRKGNQLAASSDRAPTQPMVSGPVPSEVRELMTRLAEMQSAALAQSRWVGKDFAEQSRAMHYGEQAIQTIHGQASLQDAKDLLEEGIAVVPLPFPVAPPEELN